MQKKSVSIILPTLNEVGHIKDLILKIKNELKFYNNEIIVVDDNSKDGTLEILKKMYKKKLIKLIVRKESNCLTKSIQIGIDNSKFKTICWMDADYSHHPKFLKNIIFSVTHQNFDLAVNVRRFFLRKDYKFLPGFLSFFLNIFLRITLDFKFQDYTSGFICIKKKVFKNYKLIGDYGEYFVDLIYYCIKKKFKIKQIYYKEFPRASGVSKTGSNIFDYINKGKKYIYVCFNALKKY